MSKVSQPTTTTQESENSIPVTVDITFSFLDMFVLVGVLIFVCVVILSVSCIVANFIRSVNKRGSIPISVQVEMDQLVEDSSNSF